MRIFSMMAADEEYQKMQAEYEKEKRWFERFTERLPRRLRNRLWGYPGMFYLMHHRMLTRICEEMRFSDET